MNSIFLPKATSVTISVCSENSATIEEDFIFITEMLLPAIARN
jgi:hypothetical protein